MLDKKPDPIKINNLLGRSSLKSIMVKAHVIEKLNTCLNRTLPTKLYTHCQVLNFENNIVIIGVDSAAWLTNLRYEEHDLRNAFQRELQIPAAISLKFKVIAVN